MVDVTTGTLLRAISFKEKFSQGVDIVTPYHLKELRQEITNLEIAKSKILQIMLKLWVIDQFKMIITFNTWWVKDL